MVQQRTPRQMVKALMRGDVLVRPLLLPVIFSLGSRLENLPLRDFLANPTKIANALRQIRSTLKIDGLTCYWDPLLEIEALGGRVEWKSDGSRALTATNAGSINGHVLHSDVLRQRVDAAGGISKMGRVRVAIEVLQRLKVMLKDEPALMVRVTGPHTLAMQLTAAFDSPDDTLDFAADVTGALVKDYLEAGADVVLLAENTLPTKSAADFERWRSLLDPVVNVVRFFEALPVLLLEGEMPPAEMEHVRGQTWDCALCLPQAAAARDWQGTAPWLGMSMCGLDCARSEGEFGEWAASLPGPSPSIHVSFLTTPDLPATTDLKSLTRNLSVIRDRLMPAA